MACLHAWCSDFTETSWHHCYAEMAELLPSVLHQWDKESKKQVFPQDLVFFFSVGLMKKLTFSKAKTSIFLVNPVSAEKTMPALFCVIHPKFPFKIMGLLEIRMIRFCGFKYPHAPAPAMLYIAVEVITFCCTDGDFKEMEITKNRNAAFLVRHKLLG